MVVLAIQEVLGHRVWGKSKVAYYRNKFNEKEIVLLE
jgi:hypothetical protein